MSYVGAVDADGAPRDLLDRRGCGRVLDPRVISARAERHRAEGQIHRHKQERERSRRVPLPGHAIGPAGHAHREAAGERRDDRDEECRREGRDAVDVIEA